MVVCPGPTAVANGRKGIGHIDFKNRCLADNVSSVGVLNLQERLEIFVNLGLGWSNNLKEFQSLISCAIYRMSIGTTALSVIDSPDSADRTVSSCVGGASLCRRRKGKRRVVSVTDGRIFFTQLLSSVLTNHVKRLMIRHSS